MSRTYLLGRAALALALAMASIAPASAAPAAAQRIPAVAILEIANAGMDPRVDYLSSIVQGILAFDIGSRSDLALVDRRNLDALLKEKELSLSSLGQDPDAAAAAGRLVGADWLLSGEYVFLGSDVLLTLSLTDASTAKRTVFRDRGASENLVHKLAEQVVLRLTGKEASFADPGRSRSLVSLRDETPGSIALFSPIIQAEVFVDEQFFGYTTGDATVPLVVDKLSPGKHRVRVHLDSSFGVVKLPEVSFHDWEVDAEVEANKRLTLRDATRHFNDILYKLIELGSGSARSTDADAGAAKPAGAASPAPELAFAKDFTFQDRQGADIAVRLEAKPRLAPASPGDAASPADAKALVLDLSLRVGAKAQAPASAALSLSLAPAEGGEKEGEARAGIVRLRATLERYANYWSLDWRVERTDIEQNMFRE
jgi:hypothetical protein